MLNLPTYVVITPARNEAAAIELTLQSMIAQTVRPVRWTIVSDGSTDGTDEIVSRYASQHQWIHLIRMPQRTERNFAGKVHAFNAGRDSVAGLVYDVIVSLDGDISFEPDYFAFLLEKLAGDPALGLVGTPFREISGETYDYRFVSIEHVSGACQVFRRTCFESFGGYIPVKGGAIDNIAVISARMKGWRTRTFPEKSCIHHRQMGTAQHGSLAARIRFGAKDYAIGNHPVWEIFRGLYQMSRPPQVLGGLALMAGYFRAAIRHAERPVSAELMAFHRREQMQRLRKLLIAPLRRLTGQKSISNAGSGAAGKSAHAEYGR